VPAGATAAAAPAQAAAVATAVAPAVSVPAAKKSTMPLVAGGAALLVIVLAVVGFMVLRGGKTASTGTGASGTAVFAIAPWANIDSIVNKADGKKVAGGDLVTPCAVSLPSGDYTVHASNPAFPGPLDFEVHIVEGQVQEIRQVIPGFRPEDEVARILGR
jgi:hypothetical protein